MDTVTRLAVGTLALAAVATVGGALAPVGTGVAPAAATALRPFDDCEQLRDWYVEHTIDQVGPYGWGSRVWTTAQSAPDAAAEPSAERAGSSDLGQGRANGDTGTNVQEVRVDEPDVAKTDGRIVVRLVDGRRVVITDVTGTAPRELGSWSLPDDANAQSLLLLGDHVLVATSGMVALDRTIPGPGHGSVGTRVMDLDISDPADPRVDSDTTWSGRQLALRSYDGVVRLVTSDGLPELGFVQPGRLSEEEATARNKAIVRSSRIEDWLPVLRTDDGNRPAVDCRDVQHPREWAGPDTVTVASFRPGAADRPETVAVTGAGHDVYSSADRLYVYGATAESPMRLATEPTRILPPASPRTQVHAFDLDGLAVRHTASGTIRGHVRDRWSFDEHDGRLRVAVSWAGVSGPRDNGVLVLAEQQGRLVTVGRLRGLGVDEEIKSVRWFDDLAVVVTFRQVDPLYTLDLSEPTRPRVLGELKIPGFSSYLHPVGDDRLLGLGTDTDLDGRVLGAQAAVFDISDPSVSRRLAQTGLGPETHLPAGDDPHAFTWLPELDTAVTSVQRWDESGPGASMLLLRVQPDGSLLTREITGPGGGAPRALPLQDGRVALVGDDVRLVDLAR